MNLNYETTGINFNSKGKVDEIATPQNIADDMVTLFDYTDCNRKIWMDMYCKTGNFLASLKRQGVNKNNMAAICQTLQSQMLVCRKLYGQILPEIEVEIKIKSLESCKVTRRGQVYYISNWKEKVKNNHQEAYNLIKFVVMKEMENTMSLDWTTEEDFKINNIIMNPPYNPSDLYIDFVELAHKIASKNVVAITPAKWQAKGGQKNEDFRKNIVPYMSKIVFYHNAGDVFDIRNLDGISYFLISKTICRDKCIKDVDNHPTHSLFNQDWHFDKLDFTLHSSIVNNILSKCSVSSKLKPTYNLKHKYFVHVSLMLSSGGGKTSFSNFSADGKMLVLNPMTIEEIIATGNYKNLYSSDSKSECESYISYMNTKLIRFILYVSCCGNSVTAVETWRFVPAPEAFDHIFTDEELYKKYNLTQEEINIIESVIKERN